jgi:hypothetical protein
MTRRGSTCGLVAQARLPTCGQALWPAIVHLRLRKLSDHRKECLCHAALRRALALTLSALLACPLPLLAGGPLIVGGPNFGSSGQPFTWDTSQPIAYRVDGGPLSVAPSGAIMLDNAAGLALVQNMFQVWENVPTATVRFTNAGAIQPAGTFTDGDVSNAAEFNEVAGSCDAGVQSPILFDANGTIFTQLIGDPAVIGFAGTCKLDDASGRIVSAMAVLNGIFRDTVDIGNNYELSANQFEQAFVHEFGHFLGLDHSQINVNVLNNPNPVCSLDDVTGLPLMFPVLFCQARKDSGLPPLAPDDIAWISKLYPETQNSPPNQVPFLSSYGLIAGNVFFSDGTTPAQGVNVIVRRLSDGVVSNGNEAKRIAFSAVSGFQFTGNPGQSITGDNPGSARGSRDPALLGYYEIPVTPGTYTVEVESVFPYFIGGSGVGPLRVPIPNPGAAEFWDSGESATDLPSTFTSINITAGQTVSNINFILNGTLPRFDAFESAALELPSLPSAGPAYEQPALLRRDQLVVVAREEAA